MKKTLHLIAFLAMGFFATETKAQLANGATAPDFTFTDMNGNTQNLYSYLNAGKAVAIDVSATWCGPCWSYHQGGALENFYNQYGPPGTNQAMVLFVEGDASTTNADMNGTTSGTMGNWVAGTPYPMMNPSNPSADAMTNAYQIQYYPTGYLVCPNKKIYRTDQYTKTQLYNKMTTSCTTTGVEDVDLDSRISVFPNPTHGGVFVNVSDVEPGQVNIKIYNVVGEVIAEMNENLKALANLEFDLSKHPNGMYFMEISSENTKTTKKLVLNK